MEENLKKYKERLDQVVIPEALEEAIESGFRKAYLEKRSHKRKKWWMSAALVAVLLIGFFTTIRVSPAFAHYVAEIPGMEKIVELIRNDKGMLTAIEHDYFQGIGASEKKNGIEVVIDGAIADENGLVLFYTLKADEKQKYMVIERAKLKDANGKELEFSTASYGTPHYSEKGEKSFNGTMEYFFQEPLDESEFSLELQVEGDDVKEDFAFSITLDNEIRTKKTYEINKTVSIEGQKVYVTEAVVYPLRVAVHVKTDPQNSKKLLEFQDLRLVDEKGETWSKISNGMVASNISDDETIYYLQSNYFNEPEELYLVFNKIQAVDKEVSDVVVDTEKVEILKQPDGNRLRELRISGNDIIFNLYIEKEFPYSLFSGVKDGNGNEIEKTSGFWSSDREEQGFTEIGVTIPNLKGYPNPITLELSFFPEWIEGEGKIRIK